jgi:hypothetical protein
MRRLAASFVLLCLVLTPVRAMSVADEVKAADTARVLATVRGDTQRIAALLSDQLHYGHSDGRGQTKEQFIAAVRSSQMKYEAYDYLEREVTPVSDDVATMTGRAKLKVSAGERRLEFVIQFLAIWRRESGAWHLLAYQSAQLPPAAVPPKK